MSKITTIQERSRLVEGGTQLLQQTCQNEIARQPQRVTSNSRIFDSISLPMMQYLQTPAVGN